MSNDSPEPRSRSRPGQTRGHRLFAAVYDRMSRPVERGWLGELRSELVGDLTGDVLDVGAGTGANLPYLRNARQVTVTEPDPAMRKRLKAKLLQAQAQAQAQASTEIASATAEQLSFPDESFDAVIYTLVLCSVDEPDRALAEARRVLRPDGRLIVIEHVRSTGRIARWQDRLEPLWVRLGAGCRPNRDTRRAIERAGFRFEQLTSFHPKPGIPITSPVIHGVAVPARG